MQDILARLANSSATESSHELQCRCFDAAEEISRLRVKNEECIKDANRYKYLRRQVDCFDGLPMAQVVWKLKWIRDSNKWTNLSDGNTLDQHCDKALQVDMPNV